MIKKLFLTLAFSFICIFAYADTVTYYFDAYDSGGEEWEDNPEDMVDGDTGTEAETEFDGVVQLLTGNTCDGTNLGTITKVELRVHGYARDLFNCSIDLRPVFDGGDGDDHNTSTVNNWSSYQDITSDTNAPETWSWTNVDDLDCDVVGNGASFWAWAQKVEIQVTYGGAARRRNIMVE